MRAWFLIPVVALAGCGVGEPPHNAAAPSNYGSSSGSEPAVAPAVAGAGNGVVAPPDSSPSPSPSPSPVPTRVSEAPIPAPAPDPIHPPAPGEPGGLPDDRTPLSEAPFTPESAQGAADVVQRYYAYLESGRYGAAWRLWEDGGRASGMDERAFAASFARYSEYHANIGAPGRIDAGAGQRYVTVPVQVYGRIKATGKPFSALGRVTLHRVGDIDGATARQRQWHIRDVEVKSRPIAGTS